MAEKHDCASCADSGKDDSKMNTKAGTPMEEGKCAVVHYKGSLEDGEVFDTSEGRTPLEFVVGGGQVIKGFDRAVKTMKVGEKKTIEIEPSDAYGDRDDKKLQEVPRDALPKEQEPKEGMMLIIGTPDGMRFPAKIAKVEGDKVILDLNHPLAGKKLKFELELVGIKDKPAPSGCGCCG